MKPKERVKRYRAIPLICVPFAQDIPVYHKIIERLVFHYEIRF